ncbi:hypothetical protein EYF80_001928 [Liparis tanakae]|uniref:Uncharacterized protein n=1 Tax=Liparis tanakae TaxID=230148 RepID=A0A4Z2JDP5_9TELE|nr:hypothetical protein EYF80_001928 [Liparis tanakae]
MRLPGLELRATPCRAHECEDQLVEKIKNEEAYQNRKYISRGLSEGFIRPVAALLRTWVAPHGRDGALVRREQPDWCNWFAALLSVVREKSWQFI